MFRIPLIIGTESSPDATQESSSLDRRTDCFRGARESRLDGFERREQQVESAPVIEQAFQSSRHCLVEAGTGVGKPLAYLIGSGAVEGKIQAHIVRILA